MEQVIDSSRYFVLKVVDQNTGKHAFLGIGFPERSSAFDFQIALQDFTRSNHEVKKSKADGPKLDFSLKQGQTISINLGNTNLSKSHRKNDTNLENCNL